MKKLVLLFALASSPAFSQVTIAPAVAPTTGAPTPAEIDNAFGICQAHRFKGGWQTGYESCDEVQKLMVARIDEAHRQTVLDVVKRLNK